MRNEIPVNKNFKVKDDEQIYVCIENIDKERSYCYACAFSNTYNCQKFPCTPGQRTDKKYVRFEKIKRNSALRKHTVGLVYYSDEEYEEVRYLIRSIRLSLGYSARDTKNMSNAKIAKKALQHYIDYLDEQG